MDKKDLRSQALDLLRFPLAIIVLVIHTFNTNGLRIHGTTIPIDNKPFSLAVNHIIDGFLRGQSVPIYFFISGFVFFLGIRLTKKTYLRKLRNRMNTLLIPYVIWNIVATLWAALRLLPCLSSLFPNAHLTQMDFSLPAILNTFWDASKGIFTRPPLEGETVNSHIYPQDYPLWFVRDLMIVVLCTPLLCKLLQWMRGYLAVMLGTSWFVMAYWDLGHVNQLLTAFFFFSWGAYMSISQKDMLSEFHRYFKTSLCLYPLLALLHIASTYEFPWASDTIKRLNVLVGLFFAYNVAAWLLKRRICKVSPFLASSSFFIYVTHSLMCSEMLKTLFLLFRPVSDIGVLLAHVLATTLTVSSLLLVFWLLRQYTPSFLKVIAGRK